MCNGSFLLYIFGRMSDDMDHHTLGDDVYVESFLDLKHSQPRYPCPYGCNKMIASRTIDYHKNNGCGRRHNDTIAHTELKKTFYCCGVCYAEFVTRPEFFDHLRMEHEVDPVIHNMEFQDRQTFDRFKSWLECEGGAHFRHKSGAKRRARGKGIFLACNRSGNVGSDKATGSERTGPYRLGFSCTAFIHATEHPEGHVTAEFCGDHYGHDARMRIPNVIKYIIAHKQMEGISNLDIIGYLRHHFLSIANENIYANRIIFIDPEELKSINTGSTKKWSKEGIPNNVEVWEDELLERVGIQWPPAIPGMPQRFVESIKPTTSEMAAQGQWPRPRVFDPKNRRGEGILLPFNLPDGQRVNQDEYGQEEEELVDERYLEMDYVDGYVQEEQIVVEDEEEVGGVVVSQSYQRHQNSINKGDELLEEGDVEVEVGNEVVVTTIDANNQVIDEQTACVEEHVISSPNNEIVIVDGDVEDELDDHLHHHHHSHHQLQQHRHSHEEEIEDPQGAGNDTVVERYIEATKASTLRQLMGEIESFKETVLKRTENMSSANMKSLLVRFQTLHNSMAEKEHGLSESPSMTIFPNRSKYLYRPGKGLEKPDSEYLPRGHGEVTLQPIDDEISDDEDLVSAGSSDLQYNRGIWS